MDKRKLHSADPSQKNIEKIRELFPGCVTEARDMVTGRLRLVVDFDQLRQELSGHVVEGLQERYRLDWPGRQAALALAGAPVQKTLRPSMHDSECFDKTGNIFIEGDNLDALRILQSSYAGKIKIIYIDPPYNTGQDFVYRDKFRMPLRHHARHSQMTGGARRRVASNADRSGYFHADWLSMMYPRLRLARDLLRDDGVIFISIGDSELGNLRLLCDEIFGARNFEGHIHWRRRHNQPNDPTKMIGVVAEHILAYSRNKASLKKVGAGKVALTGNFSNPDDDRRGPWASKPWRVGSDQSGSIYAITTPAGETLHGEWMGERSTYDSLLADNRIYFPNGGYGAPRKKYFEFERKEEGQCATNWWPHDQFGHNQEGNSILASLFGGEKNIFSNPKPPRLISSLMSIANCRSGDIILDFFLGSASTYHACRQYPAEVKFIGVQIPEPLSEALDEHRPAIGICRKLGLPLHIASITKERMRRVDALPGLANGTAGFRVFKIDAPNSRDVCDRPEDLSQSDPIETVAHGRTGDDLLFQVLVDWGVDLALPIRRETVQDKTVFFLGDNALIACFDHGVTEDLVKQLASREPLRVVFRDDGFISDAVKIRVAQVFRQLSPATEVRSI